VSKEQVEALLAKAHSVLLELQQLVRCINKANETSKNQRWSRAVRYAGLATA